MRSILLLFLLVAPVAARSQPFSTTGPVASLGGGTSRGGAYSVTGTAGECFTSAMSGGSLAVVTGFWSVVGTVATPDSPTLVIAPQTDGSIIVSWPSSATGFTLEQNHGLSPGGWVATTHPVSDDGVWRSIQVTAPSGVQFFRLRN